MKDVYMDDVTSRDYRLIPTLIPFDLAKVIKLIIVCLQEKVEFRMDIHKHVPFKRL